ncbi:trimethylamine methyltransferase family protein [Candidatus Formimonas warabiya]|uniref:Trimethylamine methyltransferase n=1 Tax=Formimonas warabiya TaxID=1761012 RepID=A0A3G1KXC0_FORW1|nr:trimethylamine methyltransferase family protein [Candidatus Formimonas warabiya]ATW27047.1 hypothetical protein DCMF_21825 [Candidatus Formimonas warabiya]
MRITKSNFQEQTTPRYIYLSEDQMYEIHMATLEVLERIGLRVDHEEARRLLKDAGAYMGENHVVRFPVFLVEEALQSAPSRVVLSNRDGERVMFCEKNQSYFGPGSDLPWTIDLYTGETRKSVKQDIVNASRIVDALENLDFMMCYAIAGDVTNQLSYVHEFHAMVENTRKPIVFTARDGEDFMQIVEMAAVIRGGYEQLKQNPFIACYSEPISPLIHAREGLDKLLLCAEYGIPAIYTPGAGAGATAPCSLAGLLTQVNAEILSGLVMHQLKSKGAPYIYGAACGAMDMKTTIIPHGSPEFQIYGTALAHLARFYNLPCWSTAGNSDAPVLDQQATMEWGFNIFMAQCSGANIIHDIGYLNTGLLGALEALVICNEIIGLARFVNRGIVVNKETLAVEVMERVAKGGNYFEDEHTYNHFRDFWNPDLLNRVRHDTWRANGGFTLGEKANKKAKKLLAEYAPSPLSGAMKEKLGELMAKYEAQYK